MEINDDFADWIPATDAAKLWRSPRGTKTHPSTIIRWIMTGKLEGRRRGRWWYVRRSEVLGMLRPARVPAAPPTLTERRGDRKIMDAWTDGVLKRAGVE